MPERALAGLLAAAAIGLVAWRAGSLSASGSLAAALVGASASGAGWGWALLLMLFFVSSTLLSRAGAEEKSRRLDAVVAKGGPRDAVQVLANGGLFATLAIVAATRPALAAMAGVAAGGALAAATADTWATEIGTLASAPPRSLLTLAAVEPGTSGGVSVPGSIALLAGALCIAVGAAMFRITPDVMAVVSGGVAGAMADSLLGATLQQRRWCDACERWTERRVHGCGVGTRHAAGLAWLDNDAVNFAATVVGAGTAVAVLASGGGWSVVR